MLKIVTEVGNHSRKNTLPWIQRVENMIRRMNKREVSNKEECCKIRLGGWPAGSVDTDANSLGIDNTTTALRSEVEINEERVFGWRMGISRGGFTTLMGIFDWPFINFLNFHRAWAPFVLKSILRWIDLLIDKKPCGPLQGGSHMCHVETIDAICWAQVGWFAIPDRYFPLPINFWGKNCPCWRGFYPGVWWGKRGSNQFTFGFVWISPSPPRAPFLDKSILVSAWLQNSDSMFLNFLFVWWGVGPQKVDLKPSPSAPSPPPTVQNLIPSHPLRSFPLLDDADYGGTPMARAAARCGTSPPTPPSRTSLPGLSHKLTIAVQTTATKNSRFQFKNGSWKIDETNGSNFSVWARKMLRKMRGNPLSVPRRRRRPVRSSTERNAHWPRKYMLIAEEKKWLKKPT